MTEDKPAGCAAPGPSLDLEVEPGAAQIMDCLAGAVGLARVSPAGARGESTSPGLGSRSGRRTTNERPYRQRTRPHA